MRKILSFALIMAFSLLAPQGSHAAGTVKVDIGASAPGGTWYVGLGGYAKAISQMYPEFDVTLFPGGGITNVVRVSKGQSQLGITANAFMKFAQDGTEPFKNPVQNFRAFANINDVTRIVFAVPVDSELKTVRDIVESGKPLRISMGSKVGGNAEAFVRHIFEALGTSKKDLQSRGYTLYGVTPNETASMMREGQIDVISSTNPGEHFMLTELIKDKPLRFLPYDDELVKKLQDEYGMVPATLTPDMYKPMIQDDIPVISAPSGLVVTESLPDDEVYKLAKCFVEKREDIALALPSWNTISPETVCKGMPVELHPGAARYYTEIGCLK